MRVESGLWSRCVRALEDELPGEHFNMWVRPLQAVESNGALKLLAPNRFAVDWVNAHLLSRLGEIVRRFVVGRMYRLIRVWSMKPRNSASTSRAQARKGWRAK